MSCADLIRASPSAPEINLTEAETEGLGDIRDVDVNFDGTKVVFSMRAQFMQRRENPLLGSTNISRGTLYQRDPDGELLVRLSKAEDAPLVP